MLLTWSWNTDGRHFSLHLAGMSTDDRFSTETEAREFVEQHYRPGDPDLDLPGDRDDRPRPPLTLISSALRAHQKMVVVIESVIEDSRGVRYALCGTSFSSEMHPQSCGPEAHRRR